LGHLLGQHRGLGAGEPAAADLLRPRRHAPALLAQRLAPGGGVLALRLGLQLGKLGVVIARQRLRKILVEPGPDIGPERLEVAAKVRHRNLAFEISSEWARGENTPLPWGNPTSDRASPARAWPPRSGSLPRCRPRSSWPWCAASHAPPAARDRRSRRRS